MSVMETNKVAEDNQSKQNINDSYNFILLQTQLAFFHGCRSKQAILNSYQAKSFCHTINPKLPSLFNQDGRTLAGHCLCHEA